MIDFLGACLGMLRSLGSRPGCHTCETGLKVSFGPQQQPSKRKNINPPSHRLTYLIVCKTVHIPLSPTQTFSLFPGVAVSLIVRKPNHLDYLPLSELSCHCPPQKNLQTTHHPHWHFSINLHQFSSSHAI